jgi:hypothetical protein
MLAQFVREWMERQVTVNVQRLPTTPAVGQEHPIEEQPVDPSRAIQGMHKQLRERDRQIAVLRSQLGALKLIDQDHADKQRKIKPPASLKTSEHYPGQ